MSERVSNGGYLAIGVQSDPNTVVRPTFYTLLYTDTLTTNDNFVESSPIYGSSFEVFQVLQGQRTHTGGVVVLAEPNTAGHLFNSVLVKSGTTGTSPYTHTFGASTSTAPKSYVFDISLGNVVKRFWGFKGSSIKPEWNENEMRLSVQGAAIGSFQGRKIESVVGSVVTLSTDYDQSPTTGLVANDLLRFFKADGTTVDLTVTSVDSATAFTASGTPTGVAGGDFVHLRPATPNLSVLQPFLWTKTEFRFGTTAAAALSATQTRLERGSGWEIINKLAEEGGSLRSGAPDPASLTHTTVRYNFTDRRFFDTPEQLQKFTSMDKVACVARHFAGASNQYELRVTMNHMKVGNPVPGIESGNVIYSEQLLRPQYDTSDGQGMDVKAINELSSL